MRIAIPKEITRDEQRVALVPSLIPALRQLGCEIALEHNAGLAAHFPDQSYPEVAICPDPQSLYRDADVVLKIDAPTIGEIELMKPNAIVIGMLAPYRNVESIKAMRDRPLTSFALEYIPRISRAQAMDVLSSQATVAGYKAALIAADISQRFFPMLTTAAGTIRPSQVLVIGAGVAGLQSIATARRLGALVSAYDIRPAAREQVESLGAKMIQIGISADAQGGYARSLTAEEQQMQAAALEQAVAKANAVICTALIPGKPAPKIITRSMVEQMSPGSVIVDIAASQGGNCELTVPGETITHQGVTIIGPTNLASAGAHDASQMFAKNMVNFLGLLIKDGQTTFNWEDPILKESVLTHEGRIAHDATRNQIEGGSQ